MWRDGEHEPEEDPEDWVDRVADEVEERRLQKMRALEKPEGSAEGISCLTTRKVYDWRKEPYHHGDGTSSKRWKRRSRLIVAKDAEGKRDYIFSPATSGHVLKLLPTIFFQRVSEKEEAREGEGASSQALGCLGVKDAFSQVPQEKPLKVNTRREELLVKRNLPGQRVGAKVALCRGAK